MAHGKVSVSSLNQYQSDINEVERRLVFIGETSVVALQNKVTALSARTDLEALFTPSVEAVEEVAPKTAKAKKAAEEVAVAINEPEWPLQVLQAAQLNAGQNWTASFVGIAADGDWKAAFDMANKIQSFEGVVVLKPVAEQADINAMRDKLASVEAKQARFMFGMMCLAPIGSQTWSAYKTKAAELITGAKAERVLVVPTLLGADIGVLAGRLCHRSVTIADSPMRYKTGPLLGITGVLPKDSEDKEMPIELLSELDSMRYSTPQDYPGEEGWYWGDGNTLDSETGDYKIIEVLRPVLKACRRVYKIAIPTIADRSLNSSPNSVARNKKLYMKPLLEMAAPVVINNVPFPGEIEPPTDSAVEINWVNDKATQIFITVCPVGSQKDITIGVGVDQNRSSEGES
ncbi:DUF2586 domain-containing protein [Vibrio vulnificus]|uniref:DUF2586 domain-containing protein n=1 Tax=Vibrio vulnificus TaxID=672 RepID=UPI0010290BEE|nr:DUF2586 domain-containing protein [Vibrio vulnificus]RZP88991.1 DUF2586 family protein [Vibrio vulnificus]